MLSTLRSITGLIINTMLFSIEAACWLLYIGKELLVRLYDAAKGLWSVRGGVLRCGECGGTIPLAGDDLAWECAGCGWRWSGRRGTAVWCPNPECVAPAASYVRCPSCGIGTVRNPFRWGR